MKKLVFSAMLLFLMLSGVWAKEEAKMEDYLGWYIVHHITNSNESKEKGIQIEITGEESVAIYYSTENTTTALLLISPDAIEEYDENDKNKLLVFNEKIIEKLDLN